jgi:glutaredoxin-like protein NrdH
MKVMMYALSTCAWCRRTKRFLNESGVEYDFVDVDLLDTDERAAKKAELKQWNPNGSYPTVVVDDEHVVVGFNKDKLREVLGL